MFLMLILKLIKSLLLTSVSVNNQSLFSLLTSDKEYSVYWDPCVDLWWFPVGDGEVGTATLLVVSSDSNLSKATVLTSHLDSVTSSNEIFKSVSTRTFFDFRVCSLGAEKASISR